MECCHLHLHDINFDRGKVLIRNDNGAKDRVTMLPKSLVEPLKVHLVSSNTVFDGDTAKGKAEVYCMMRWNVNTPSLQQVALGNMCFALGTIQFIRALGVSADIIWMKS